MPSLVALAEELLANAKKLEAYTQAQGLPEPNFEHDIFGSMPMEQEQVRTIIMDTSQQLRSLVAGPMTLGQELELNAADNAALRMVYTYRMIHHVPLEGSVSFAELGEKCGLEEREVRRFVRHAMSNHIFVEKEPGRVSHSAITRTMLADTDFEDDIGVKTCEFTPSFAMLPEALAKWPQSQEREDSGFSLAWPMRDGGEKQPFYEYLEHHEERRRRFGQSMKFLTKGEGFSLRHLTSTYPWSELDKPGTKLVDVGGGHGAVCQHLAQHTKNIEFVVQDLPGTLVTARKSLPAEFKDRIEFAEHDFFKPQTIKDADIYFIRWIFHNYSDKYAAKVLENLIPAMRPGSRVIVFEMVLPDRPAQTWFERLSFHADMIMKAVWNATERTEAQWLDLFQKASPKFAFKGITRMPGATLSIIEHVWEE